jgi:hypothetical protein
VKLNGNDFRYFFPVYLVLIAHVSLLAYAVLRRLPDSSAALVAVACLAALLYLFVSLPIPIDRYVVLSRAAPLARLASDGGIRIVAGDYWSAWPVVFDSLSQKREVYGLTYRGNGSLSKALATMDAETARAGSVKVLCVDATPEKCVGDIAYLTQRAWTASNVARTGNETILSLSPK